MQPSYNQPNILTPYNQVPMAKPKKSKRWILPVVMILIMAIVIAVVLVITMNMKKAEDERIAEEEFIEHAYDQTADPETLNEEFAQAVKGGEFSGYETEVERTQFYSYSPISLCEELELDCPDELRKPSADDKIDPINSNALDYYLDSGYIVIMMARYEEGGSLGTSVIYARELNYYLSFNTLNFKDMFYATRSQLFDDVVGVPTFYANKKEQI